MIDSLSIDLFRQRLDKQALCSEHGVRTDALKALFNFIYLVICYVY